MDKKFGAIICIALAALMMTSCGKYSKLNETLDKIEITEKFPVPVSDAIELSEAEEQVYNQQISLCRAFSQAYKETDIETLRKQHPELNRNKMMSTLSDKRNELNNESTVTFYQNLKTILENVEDVDNKTEYMQECFDEAKAFYNDYDKLTNAGKNNFVLVSKIFITYAFSENKLAKRVLVENEELIIESATLSIEKNADTDEGFRANIEKNNELIKAVNEVLGGVDGNSSYRKRINTANKKLLEKTLKSINNLSQIEKDAILNRFEEA